MVEADKNHFLAKRVRSLMIAGYVIFASQLLFFVFTILQSLAGVSIDLLFLGFGYVETEVLASVLYLLASSAQLVFGFGLVKLGQLIKSKFFLITGWLTFLINVAFLAVEIFERIRRLPDTPFLWGFYPSDSSDWVFYFLDIYTLVAFLAVILLAISLILFGKKEKKKVLLVTGVALFTSALLGGISGYIYDLGIIMALVALTQVICSFLVPQQIRFYLKKQYLS